MERSSDGEQVVHRAPDDDVAACVGALMRRRKLNPPAPARDLARPRDGHRRSSDRPDVSAPQPPRPFEVHEPGVLLHGTKAHLSVGDLLGPGFPSNFEDDRTMNHVYVTATLDAATWGAELARGEGRGRIYLVQPLGALEDDPNLTDKKFPGNPTCSYRSREAVRIVGELVDWVGHSPEQLQAMRDGLTDLKRRGAAVIEDDEI